MNNKISKIGSNIRLIRKAKDITLNDLSELTGYSVSHLSEAERGINSLSLEALYEIAEKLQVPISALINDDGGSEQDPQDCPFCGRKYPILNEQSCINYVLCPGCGLCGPESDSQEASVKIWNRIRVVEK